MYHKLKKKLILLYWISASLILTGVLGGILITTIRQQREEELQTFESSADAYVDRIQTSLIVNLNWIRQLEMENQWYLYVEEAGQDLELPNVLTYDGEVSEVFEKTKDQILLVQPDFFYMNNVGSQKKSEVVKFQCDRKTQYYGRIYHTKSNADTLMTFIIVTKLASTYELSRKMIRIVILCEVCGSFLFFLRSYCYVRYVVRPVEEADQKQKEFVASVSHELRSPLAVFKAGIGSMKKELHEGKTEGLAVYLYPMDGECTRMSRLVEDMLLLTAMGQKSWSIRKSEVDIETMLIECYDAFTMMNVNIQDKIQIDLSQESLPTVEGDCERLKQVIMILLDNAMSYTDLAQGICLRAAVQRRKIVIEVIDHGPGLTDAEKKKVFERFYRQEESRTDRTHFGLGLSIAKRLVELHGGTIEIKDTHGHGATFVVSLPYIES